MMKKGNIDPTHGNLRTLHQVKPQFTSALQDVCITGLRVSALSLRIDVTVVYKVIQKVDFSTSQFVIFRLLHVGEFPETHEASRS